MRWLNRFVFYAEYLHAATYYHQSAPSSVPNHDVRVGISFSIGEWYHGIIETGDRSNNTH